MDSSSVTLMEPNFLTLARKDSSLVSVYYIHLTKSAALPTLSIIEQNLVPFDIQPNPVVDILNIDLEKEFAYTIQNARGQVLQKGRAISQIEVMALPDGIYFIQIQDKDNLYHAQKFVKQ